MDLHYKSSMSLRGTGRGGPLRRAAESLEVLGSAGFLSPRFLMSLAPAMKKFGTTSATGFHAAAARNPEGVAVIDLFPPTLVVFDGEGAFVEQHRLDMPPVPMAQAFNATSRVYLRMGFDPTAGAGPAIHRCVLDLAGDR